MASTKEYLEFVLGQITGVDVAYKKMMGEYLLYVDGVLVGGIYDDRLLFKATEKAKLILPNSVYALPYEGAKPMLLCDFVDDGEKLSDALKKIVE